ncbi:MAG: O-antigen ligase family protein [Saprospiraceae bacterium]
MLLASSISKSYRDLIFPILVLVSVIVGICTAELLWIALPLGLLFIWLSIERVHWIYFILLAVIPFSTEMELTGGFSTDFPDEPLMWWLFLLGVLLVISRWQLVKPILKEPITWILALHFCWIFVTCLGSESFFISLKYWIAKSWYLMVFYILPFILLKNENRWKLFAWVSLAAASCTVFIIEARHSSSGFAFTEINKVVRPFYRNHVNYACLLVCIFPYLYPLIKSSKTKIDFQKARPRGFLKALLYIIALVLLIGITFAYTRAAYVSLVSIAGTYFIIRFKLVNVTSILVIIIVTSSIIYYNTNNHFLNLAPEYNQAITHTDFGNLLEATPQGKDISTMERLYRWVAGFRMIGEKYITGFGPNNFYDSYHSYTLNQFTTYVSENKERSTIHNYYLMTAVEQGIPGLMIFLTLIYFYFKTMESLWFKVRKEYKPWLLASLWSFGSILLILIFNDMVETDKVGSYFFINIAILVKINQLSKADE